MAPLGNKYYIVPRWFIKLFKSPLNTGLKEIKWVLPIICTKAQCYQSERKLRDISELWSQGLLESSIHTQCYKIRWFMIFLLLLNKLKGTKVTALFLPGLTNLCNAWFAEKKSNSIIANFLCLRYYAKWKSLNTLSHLILVTKGWGMYYYSLSTRKDTEVKPF